MAQNNRQSSSNQLLVPGAAQAIDQMKFIVVFHPFAVERKKLNA